MQNLKFVFKNELTRSIEIASEPEGAMEPLTSGSEIEIDVFGDTSTALQLVVSESSSGLTISIWPDNGEYSIKWKREERP